MDDDAIILFSPSEAGKYEMVTADVTLVRKQLEGVTIANQDQAHRVHDGLSEVKRILGTIEETRKAQVGPLNDQVRTINSAWRPLTTALEAIEATAKRKLVAWTQAERERVAREQRAAQRAQEEAARREAEALARAEAAKNSKVREKALAQAATAGQQLMEARVAEPMNATTGFKTEQGTSSLRAVWKYAVLDEKAVPRQYLALDEKAIKRAIAEGARDIPGLSIYQEEVLATRVG